MEKDLLRQIIIPSELSGKRLDQVLAKLFPNYSRSYLQRLNCNGQITVNQQQKKQSDIVYHKDEISISWSAPPSPKAPVAENIPLEIVYVDSDILIINKPAELVVHPGAGNRQHTLLNGLLYYAPELCEIPRCGIVHRLDKDTTGLMVVARHISAHNALVTDMQNRRIQRVYTTIVHGIIESNGCIDKPIGRHKTIRTKMAIRRSGKAALTHYQVLKHYPATQPFLTQLKIRLGTGRTHQIRVHMAAIHHPVLGDPTYGGQRTLAHHIPQILQKTIYQFPRQALHANQLQFSHPINKTPMCFEIDLAKDFADLLKTLKRY